MIAHNFTTNKTQIASRILLEAVRLTFCNTDTSEQKDDNDQRSNITVIY